MTEHSSVIPGQIEDSRAAWAMAFAPNGKHLVGSCYPRDSVQVWRMPDGKRLAKMAAERVLCPTVSNDGKYIAAGTWNGEVIVWNAKTYEEVFKHSPETYHWCINGVDFSPADSMRFMVASNVTATVWDVRIEHEVRQYYRYATFSHKWGDNEPLFEHIIKIAVHDIKDLPAHNKLQMFCKVVRDAGIQWAWSDTCCINKSDHFVLQEALVSMFRWYQGSALTVVHLCDVDSPSRRGDLVGSVWNSRAWTFQEYHASKVVQFYTKDWRLYGNLDIPNHKESPEIISEMEEATGVSARTLMELQPGVDDMREKLRLASTRQTTRVEDAAYSLFGIFSTPLPVVYGEGDNALGRLLAQLLTSSGDTSVLAWIGRSGSFNSCLPTNITVFNGSATSHIPSAIEGDWMETLPAGLPTSSISFASAMKLHDQLRQLPVPYFVGKRMKLPCIIFKLGPLSASWSAAGNVFRAKTAALGIVEILTKEDLSCLDSLYLIHPWIDFLLNQKSVGSVTLEMMPGEITDDWSFSTGEFPSLSGPSNIVPVALPTQTTPLVARFGRQFVERFTTTPQDAVSLKPPSSLSSKEKYTQALRFAARLQQPFGALLFTPTRKNVQEYRRVASESLITVQAEKITPAILNKLTESVRTLDVL